MQKFLVIDDLAIELHEKPVYIPIPEEVFLSEDMLKEFTMKTYVALMTLPYWKWYHSPEDIAIGGFYTRNNCIYPEIST